MSLSFTTPERNVAWLTQTVSMREQAFTQLFTGFRWISGLIVTLLRVMSKHSLPHAQIHANEGGKNARSDTVERLNASGKRPSLVRPPCEIVTNIDNTLSVSTKINFVVIKCNSWNFRRIYQSRISILTFTATCTRFLSAIFLSLNRLKKNLFEWFAATRIKFRE